MDVLRRPPEEGLEGATPTIFGSEYWLGPCRALPCHAFQVCRQDAQDIFSSFGSQNKLPLTALLRAKYLRLWHTRGMPVHQSRPS
jgi:hypothetical protein